MTLQEMFHDMISYLRANPGAKIVSRDDPYLREIGWTSSNDRQKRWSITLTRLQRERDLDEKVKLVTRPLSSPKGREDIIEILELIAHKGSQVDDPYEAMGFSGEQLALLEFIGNPPLPAPPPVKNRFQIMEDL